MAMLDAKPHTEAAANSIATSLKDSPQMGELSFTAIILILMQFLPMIIECFDPDDGSQAKKYIEKRWKKEVSSSNGHYKRLVKATTRQAKRAARRQKRRITWSQAREIALATLDNIKSSDDRMLDLVIDENAEA